MSDTVRLGVIGHGAEGGFYTRLLTDRQPVPNHPDVPGVDERLVLGAICDTDETRRADAERLGVPFFTSVDDLLTSGAVDAIVTTVPHYLHPEMAIAALEAGLHVLSEKPAGVYTRQVRRMNEAAAAHPDQVFAVFFNQRTNPLYRHLKDVLDSGELGALRHTSWLITNWWRPQGDYDKSAWRATWGGEGGGVLVNQAPHQLDLWQWLCGIPETVFAKCRFGFRRAIAVEDEVNALVTFAGGATGSLVTCTHDMVGTDRLEILCDTGRIVVEDSSRVTITRLDEAEQDISSSFTPEMARGLFRGEVDVTTHLSTETLEYAPGYPQHAQILSNFCAAILDGAELVGPGSEGINGVRLANAIHLSSWLDREIALAELDEDAYLAELNRRIADEGGGWPRRD